MLRIHFSARSLAWAVPAMLLAACATQTDKPGARAVAKLAPTTAGNASGEVSLTQYSDYVLVQASVRGLKPDAEHGFHIHAKPDCSGDGTKSGDHFNPDGHAHGHPNGSQRHAGAMINLKADAYGEARFTQKVDQIRLDVGKYSVVGMPVIVHARADDYSSQPLGNAGPRIACGLIDLVR